MSGKREDRIKQRAHALWLEQGQPEGRDQDHWHQAASEVDAEDGSVTGRTKAAKTKTKTPKSPAKEAAKDAAEKAPAASAGAKTRAPKKAKAR